MAAVFVFMATYALFSVAGFLFRIDRAWYDALAKPGFTPPGGAIGLVWAVLFALISLAVALLYRHGALDRRDWPLLLVLVLNYSFNQAYSYVQFVRKDWLLATLDAGAVAATALLLIVFAWRHSRLASALFVPYAGWSTFATYLSWVIYRMNP